MTSESRVSSAFAPDPGRKLGDTEGGQASDFDELSRVADVAGHLALRGGASILFPSFLVGTLKAFGPLLAPRLARQFLDTQGKMREVFLPFFYQWLDEHPRAQDQALRLIRVQMERERLPAPRVFHAPYLGRRLTPLRYWRNLADPQYLRQHVTTLQRECRFLGRLRREFDIPQQILYVIHLGLRGRQRAADALRTSIAALQPSLDAAREAGVILAIENIGDRLGDTDHVGGTLNEVEDALGALGATEPDAPVGWTFDLSHALLTYRGNTDAVKKAASSLLPSLVHLHVNAPHLNVRDHGWGDRHEAPTEGDPHIWDLLRLACTSSRFRQFRTMTYEVHWAVTPLRSLLGGSSLPRVMHGLDLVREVASRALGGLDERESLPYTADASLPETIGSGSPEPILGV
ncbi:MAG: TIM barrel protein [bacterium]|nr:TIM barrel protein [bacterium]